ncbi:MAG: twin-arginine translocation signal domain-containing protein, partial [Anaerolineaceae bacterium]|nr:twin-arginine translocation signal domain-containing protein [Anaerolineaceae bacterium]
MLSRRAFLKAGLMGGGALALIPSLDWGSLLPPVPEAQRLGRNCTNGWINVRKKPDPYSESLGVLYEDSIVVWLREVIGAPSSNSRRWVETPEGYIYAPALQPVRNLPNQPLTSLPETSMGRGMWMEVTVPFVNIYIANPPARSPWIADVAQPRLYYSQVMWVDDIMTDSQGNVLYRANEKYGSYGDIFWAAAEAFRPITQEEIAPINPQAENKRVVVDVNHQQLTCYEGNTEVYFCQVSTGAKFDFQGNVVETWATPLGAHLPWRKVISIHMAGGSTGVGWDTPGIPWTILFDA